MTPGCEALEVLNMLAALQEAVDPLEITLFPEMVEQGYGAVYEMLSRNAAETAGCEWAVE